MLKFYNKMSDKVKICYGLAFLAVLVIFVLTILMYYAMPPQMVGTINIVLILLSVAIIGSASLVVCKLMKNAVIYSEKNIQASDNTVFHVKQIVSLIALTSLVSGFISILGGIVISYVIDMFSMLRLENFQLFCTIIKIPLFIIFLVFLALIIRYTGLDHTATKSFNPHLMFIALIFSFAFMLPGTVRDYMYDNSENRGAVAANSSKNAAASQGKINYNLQTIFSENINLYKDNRENALNDQFSVLSMIIGILASMAIQISLAMTAYNIGRRTYYAKHPRMSEEELYMSQPNVPS